MPRRWIWRSLAGLAVAGLVWLALRPHPESDDPTPATLRYELDLTMLDPDSDGPTAEVVVDHSANTVRIESDRYGDLYWNDGSLEVPMEGLPNGAAFVSVDPARVLPEGLDLSVAVFDEFVAIEPKECLLPSGGQVRVVTWLLEYDVPRCSVCGDSVKPGSSNAESVGAAQEYRKDPLELPPRTSVVDLQRLSDAEAVIAELKTRFGAMR